MGIFDTNVNKVFLSLFSFPNSVNPTLLKMIKDLQKEVDRLKEKLWEREKEHLKEKLNLEFKIKNLRKELSKVKKGKRKWYYSAKISVHFL